MNLEIKAMLRKAKLRSRHNEGYRAGLHKLSADEIVDREEHYKEAYRSGKNAAESGISRSVSIDTLYAEQSDFIYGIKEKEDSQNFDVYMNNETEKEDDETQNFDVLMGAEIEEDSDDADADEAEQDVADLDEADLDEADWDQGDYDEADDEE